MLKCSVCFTRFDGEVCPICHTDPLNDKEPMRVYTSNYCGCVKSGIEDEMAHDIAVHEVIKYHAEQRKPKKVRDERILDTRPTSWKHVL